MTAKSGQDALNNADGYHTYSPGYCLKWVRTCWELGSLYGSAIDAWHGAYKKHPGDRNPPTGAPTFYKGGSYGHIVVARKHDSGNMRSTDCQTTGNVNNDSVSWPERAWGFEYLGWTEDLNGVDLPLGEDEDMPLTDEDLEKIAHRVNKVLGDYTAEGDPRDGYNQNSEPDPEQGDTRLRQIENVVRDIQTRVKRLEG